MTRRPSERTKVCRTSFASRENDAAMLTWRALAGIGRQGNRTTFVERHAEFPEIEDKATDDGNVFAGMAHAAR